MSMMWRSYNERAEPRNEEIIEKAVVFAKKVILDFYNLEEGFSQETRVFLDKERSTKTDKLNYAFSFFQDKKNIGKGLTEEDFRSIDDRILSAVKVYGLHLKEDKKHLMLEELEEEIRLIDKMLKEQSYEHGNYDLYTSLYDELLTRNKLKKPFDNEKA